jgi:uncharacterized membrane protein (DUF2068 family)
MASAGGRPGGAAASALARGGHAERDQGRLLPLLAAERMVRAALLVGVGLVLLTHARTNWAELARRFAEQVGLDPSRNETGRLVSRLAGLGPQQIHRYAAIALGYGVLEAVEGYGLLRRRRWGEYLTIVSTAVLLIPEVQELSKHPTAVKGGGLALNVIIVGYLVVRVLRRRRGARP